MKAFYDIFTALAVMAFAVLLIGGGLGTIQYVQVKHLGGDCWHWGDDLDHCPTIFGKVEVKDTEMDLSEYEQLEAQWEAEEQRELCEIARKIRDPGSIEAFCK